MSPRIFKEAMTFWDNPEMIVQHLRRVCIETDDTGICEMVMANEKSQIHKTKSPSQKQGKSSTLWSSSEEGSPVEHGEYSHTFDIDVPANITPSNNQKSHRKKAESCRSIQWKDNGGCVSYS